MKLLLFLFAALLSAQCFSQEDSTTIIILECIEIDFPKKQAAFPGGSANLKEYVRKNCYYPDDIRDQKIEGIVIVRFTVGTDGRVSDVKIMQSLHPELDRIVLMAVLQMPPWIPAEENGKKVRTRFDLPVEFKITG